MKQQVKIIGINGQGVKVTIKEFFEFPDFEEKPGVVYNGVNLGPIDIHSQKVDFLDEIDMTNFMYSNDLYLILERELVVDSPKKKKVTLEELIKQYTQDEKLVIDILVTAKEIAPLLKGKKVENQLLLILSHLNLAYKAVDNAYKNILITLKKDVTKSKEVTQESLDRKLEDYYTFKLKKEKE